MWELREKAIRPNFWLWIGISHTRISAHSWVYTGSAERNSFTNRARKNFGTGPNSLHWVLDVTFREDDSRVRHRTDARNFALLRKIALNLVAGDRSSQTSLRGRRKKAAWNDDYMLRIITRQAHA